jgi:hypothetical protein
LSADELGAYIEILLDKVEAERFPRLNRTRRARAAIDHRARVARVGHVRPQRSDDLRDAENVSVEVEPDLSGLGAAHAARRGDS